MPFINTNTQKKEEKYRFVDEILSAPDYYRVLGIKKDTPREEIRRAYIRVKKIEVVCKTNLVVIVVIREVEYVIRINLYHLIHEQLKVFNVKTLLDFVCI